MNESALARPNPVSLPACGRLASWILEYVPEHTCFVEVVGGAAGVLVNKDPEASTVEVYNDRDGDLVQFFEIEHWEFVEALGELDGSWVVSYAELPDGVEEYRVVGRGERNFMGNGKSGSAKRTREHLVMNLKD